MASETKTPTRRFLPGNFLVATPFIQNSPYQHSVVLVLRHDDRGAVGLVMDNQLTINLRDAGGLFQGTARHRGNLNGVTARGRDLPGELTEFRMFKAMALWPAGKLEHEVDIGVWMITPAQLDVAFRSEDLWVDLVRQIGRRVLQDGLAIRKFPANPILN